MMRISKIHTAHERSQAYPWWRTFGVSFARFLNGGKLGTFTFYTPRRVHTLHVFVEV